MGTSFFSLGLPISSKDKTPGEGAHRLFVFWRSIVT